MSELFAPIVSIYGIDPEGKYLVDWLRDDWAIFSHEKMDNSRAKDLLAEILDDGEIVRKLFSPLARYQIDRFSQWGKLCDELMYKNRYFPDTNIDLKRLEDLLKDHLVAEKFPQKWYRARIQDDTKIYSLNEMGAPPNRLASHGRANPPGIPYLYLGSTGKTAISEVRPHTGQLASIAEFIIPDSLSLIDLRHPRKLASPFIIGDEDQIGLLRSDISFLERLGKELTRPVLPKGASIDYIPSQYLCEFIKTRGHDGVIYKSSVGDGMNLALFDPKRAVPTSVQQYRVDRVTVDLLNV
ncbi:RES family NAD+ phosphorylase [Azospirillum endophyticum]